MNTEAKMREPEVHAELDFSVSEYNPSYGVVVIEPPLVKETKGGIILPDAAVQKRMNVKLLAVNEKSNYKVGDEVMLGFTSSQPIILSFKDQKGWIISENSVVGTINRKKTNEKSKS